MFSQIIHFNRIFHYKPSSYWGTPISGPPPISGFSQWFTFRHLPHVICTTTLAASAQTSPRLVLSMRPLTMRAATWWLREEFLDLEGLPDMDTLRTLNSLIFDGELPCKFGQGRAWTRKESVVVGSPWLCNPWESPSISRPLGDDWIDVSEAWFITHMYLCI